MDLNCMTKAYWGILFTGGGYGLIHAEDDSKAVNRGNLVW